jgi:glycosyltransferase involved in cell wall biosynthesis
LDSKTKILFTSTVFTSFIKEDLLFLRDQYKVQAVIGKGLSQIIKLFFGILNNDINFIWFGSVYSSFVVFFSRLFGKKTLIVIGGVDVAKEPSINYGIWNSPWKGKLVGYALRNADRVLSVDPFLSSEAKRLAKYDGSNIIYVPTGYDFNFWQPAGKKDDFILSVGVCEDEWRMMKKGYDKLIEVARSLPKINFKIIGIKADLYERIKKNITPNVEVISFVDKNELLKYYQKAKVYCQVSYHEGLPNALCEAMLCGCLPVGTDRGGIPTGIGDTGIIVPFGDMAALINAFNIAINCHVEKGKIARERIIENFPLQKRHDSLKVIISSLGN